MHDNIIDWKWLKYVYIEILSTDNDVDGVLVTGVKGYHPSDGYKVSATYMDGFRATAVSVVGGRNAVAKGRRTAESQVKRCFDKQCSDLLFLPIMYQIILKDLGPWNYFMLSNRSKILKHLT